MRILKTFSVFSLFAIGSLLVILYLSPKLFMKTAYALVKLELGDLPEISSSALLASIEKSDHIAPEFIVVDVRTPEERLVSIIPGAVDPEFFERHQADYQNKKIIVYCTIGYRSGFYTLELLEKGLDAYNLSEGIQGWTYAEGPLLDSHGHSTKKVHVYSRPWDLAIKNYIAVY